MIEFYINNPILIPFLISFLLGWILVIMAPVKYMTRKRKIIITPLDVLRYNRREAGLLLIGITLGIVGIVGTAIICETYGYDIVNTDEYGNRSIEHIGPKIDSGQHTGRP